MSQADPMSRSKYDKIELVCDTNWILKRFVKIIRMHLK